MPTPINYTVLAKALHKLVQAHCTGAPADMGELLANAVKQQAEGSKPPKLSVSIGLSEEDAREMIRESNIVNAKQFLERMALEQAVYSGQLIYVLLKEGHNIATRDKQVADAYYNTGEYHLIEVKLID